MRPGSPLIDGAEAGARPIATDGGADGRVVEVVNDDGTIEADGVTEADAGDNGRGIAGTPR